MAETNVIATPRPGARAAAPTVQVFVRDRETESMVRQSLNNLDVRDADFVAGDIDTAITRLAQSASPRLLIIDISGVTDPVTRINALANLCEPTTAVIVIGAGNDIVLYRDLKRAGVSEYFFKPVVSDLIMRACNNALTGGTETQANRTGKLVFVVGVRGGVGATTIAVNTAWHLAETRQRWVMLLDLDLQAGDAALQLDETPNHALREAIEYPDRVDKLFLERAVTPVDRRIDLLASLEPLGETISFNPTAVIKLLQNLMQRYRFIFVDLPSAQAAQLLIALQLPSICVLVSDGTLVSARDIGRWRNLIGASTPDRAVLHVLNKHGAADALPDADFARAVGQAPDIVVPYDRQLGAASVLGVKGTQKCAAFTRGIAPLLRYLSGEHVASQRTILQRMFG